MRTVSELIFQLSVYHLNTFGMQRESSSPSSASDWSLTDINHGFLECLGMLGNVRQWKVGQEFQASLLCQKHDHHKLTKFQQRRWKHLCVTDRFQQEEEWSGGHWQRGTWTYSAAVRTETTKQLLAHTYCTYTMYILFLMCALLQKHSLADKELFLKSCFRIWCAGISLSYKKTQTFSQDSMQSCEKLTTTDAAGQMHLFNWWSAGEHLYKCRSGCTRNSPRGQTRQLRETAYQTLQASVRILNVKVNVSAVGERLVQSGCHEKTSSV